MQPLKYPIGDCSLLQMMLIATYISIINVLYDAITAHMANHFTIFRQAPTERAFASNMLVTIFDISIIIIPLIAIFSTTQHIHCVYAVSLALLLMLVFLYKRKNKETTSLEAASAKNFIITEPRRIVPITMIDICLCIFFVDFSVFPKFSAKLPFFGHSIMDFGTGTMLFTDAYISTKGRRSQSKKKLSSTLHQTAVLVLIGVARYAINSLAGKVSDVNEYGCHWNFFFTLAFMRLVDHFVPEFICNHGAYICYLVMLVYDQVLKHGLCEYIFDAPRDNIFSKNRDGILQLLSYSACTICGIACARKISNIPDTIRNTEMSLLTKTEKHINLFTILRCAVYIII